MIGMSAPERCERLILEAFHFYRRKPSSRSFFQRFADHPEHVNEKLQTLLVADHGEPQWKNVVQRNCRVWLRLAAESVRPDDDLYGGRLSDLQVPVTFVHGRGDPRTEPGEIERASEAIAGAEVRFIEEGRHSPHSEGAAWQEWNRILGELLG
jgi:pimeloyl-ACP methyl ester carboxylesterase